MLTVPAVARGWRHRGTTSPTSDELLRHVDVLTIGVRIAFGDLIPVKDLLDSIELFLADDRFVCIYGGDTTPLDDADICFVA